jgi:hypothetical protein
MAVTVQVRSGAQKATQESLFYFILSRLIRGATAVSVKPAKPIFLVFKKNAAVHVT